MKAAAALQKYFKMKIGWRWEGNGYRACRSPRLGAKNIFIKIGDFPAEDLYIFIIDGQELGGFNDWPKCWIKKISPLD